MTNPTCEWEGASGRKYLYHVHPRHPSIKADQHGNYIYAKIVKGEWVPIYIGEGDLSVRCTTNHHQSKCIDAKGATHVHLRLNKGGKDAQSAEESDLLESYPMAYTPTGCNVKEGG